MPPGVNENMIPGNRPEDLAEEHFWTAFEEKLAEEGIKVPDGENDTLDAWNADWFIRAVDMARNMGYNLGYAEGEGDRMIAAAFEAEELDGLLDRAMDEFRKKMHAIITEIGKKHADE
jgi:hypothetical protein